MLSNLAQSSAPLYLVAVVHLRQRYARHVAGFREVVHLHNGVLAGVGDLVLGGRLHRVAKHGFDWGVSLRQQPGVGQRALLALAAQHVLIRQVERRESQRTGLSECPGMP